MRPGRIFLFLFTVVLFLSVLAFMASPEKFSFISSLSEKDKERHAGTDSVFYKPVTDSLEPDTHALVPVQPLQGSPASEACPGDFIADSLEAGKQVRIIFYGDSQLEGDRITSHLRKILREEGGGSGPGLISPVMPVMYTRSFVVKSSSNWSRYTLLDYKNGILTDNSLGPMLSLCRFTKPGERNNNPITATVRISTVPGADRAVSKYDNLRILYGNCIDTTSVQVSYTGQKTTPYQLRTGSGPFEYQVTVPSVSDVTIEFRGHISPDIYAISIESRTGIIVDNVPVRGSAGLEFVMTDSKVFAGSLELLEPDLIVMQYGLNVVRNVRNDYHYYEEGLVRQIEYLRDVSGGVPVVLVSLTDMAEKSGDSVSVFSNIPAIRDAQKRAASRTGIFFWDAWASMGGTGSIVKWHEEVPSLASNDLAHFSNAGADTIAKLMYRDLFDTRKTMVPERQFADQLTDTVSLKPVIASVPDTSDIKTGSPSPGLLSFIKYNPRQSFIFTTPAFWIFFLVVMAGFALTRKKRAMCHTWLLLVSFYFYYKAGGLYFILLLFTCLSTFFTGLLTDRSGRAFMRKFWLVVNIVLLLGLLSYFKYAGFFTERLNMLLGIELRTYDFFSSLTNTLFGTGFNVSEIILPVGISFFTFQAISYSIDVYRKRMAAVTSILDFSFYLTFFPQLVAGPIVRASEFIPQMNGQYTISKNEFGHALYLILQGLIKKMIISDFIALNFIDRVFEAPALFSGFENLTAVYGYGLQIYCDFSGYTDIAIGVALLMGFRLPLNFNSPYKASNISDFWKRWHISLSRWLKDYLYIPLGGNRKGTIRTGLNLLITMVLGGLWHGAATRFVTWGALHGIALIANKIWQKMFSGIKRSTTIARVAGTIITFNFVSFAWIFFRSGSTTDAFLMISQIFQEFSPGKYSVVLMAYLPVLVLILTGYIIHFLPVTIKEAYRGLFIRMPLYLKFVIVLVVCVVLHKVGSGVIQPFIYFRF